MEKDKLYAEDLITMAKFIQDGIMEAFEDPDKDIKQKYIRVLQRMADSMLHDDAIVVDDDYFEREHGV